MREIKFRAWDVDAKEFEYWDIYQQDQTHVDWINPEIVNQYIGLKDKNGKEIYERDIICVRYNMDCSIYKKFEVKWGVYNIGCNGHEYDMFVVGPYVEDEHMYCLMIDGQSEIIGNIYENPELL